MADEYVLADSGVISRLTSTSEHSIAYRGWIGEHRIAINFQTEAELLSCNFGPARMQRLHDLLAVILKLPQTGATIVHNARVAEKRREFQHYNHVAGEVGDGDVWIISSCLEHELTWFSHDGPAVHLGRALGIAVFTNLPDLLNGNPKPQPSA